MVINKKIKRTMLERKSQYIGSLALIIISCLLFTLFNQLSINMTDIASSFEKDNVQEDASFITSGKLTNIPELESRFNMKIEESSSFDYNVTDSSILRIFRQNTKVDLPAIIEGENLKNGSILIDPAYAAANKLKIRDSININNSAFMISGFMSLPNYIYPLKQETDLLNDPGSFGIGVLSRDDYNSLNMGNSFYAVKFNDDNTNLDSRITEFKNYLKEQKTVILKWTDISQNPRVIYVTAKVDGINKLSSSMPVIILLLTCILSCIVMWRMLKNESVIIGTLYALGYRKREIIKHYLMYPLYISISGGIIGTILGALSLKPMLSVMVSYFNMPVNSIMFDFGYIAVSILLPVVFLIISGYLVVNRALKLSPVELIRGGREKAKVGLLERKLRLEKLKFTSKFKIREQIRSIPRSIFLFLGVVLATMLLLIGFTASSSMNFLMKHTYGETYKYNYQYMFNSIMQGQPSNGEAFSISSFALQSDNKTAFEVIGINKDSKYILLKDSTGNKLSASEVIATRPLADKLGIRPGDEIRTVNKLDSREYTIKVDSIAETYVGEYIYMPLDKFNAILNLPENSYMGLFSSDKLDVPQNKLLSSATIGESMKSFESITQPLMDAVGIMAFMSFIIGLIVIYVVTSLIIEENREGISLMKVFGYRKKEVNSLILNSSTYLVVLGYIAGVPLILAALKAMFDSVTRSMNFSFPVTIDYAYILIGFVVIYLTYEISKLLSRRKVSRISMSEILKAQME